MGSLDAILLGGEPGQRYALSSSKNTTPREFCNLGDAPVFIHALRSLLDMDCFRQIVVAFPEAHLGLAEEYIEQHLPTHRKTIVRLVASGQRRQESSYLALAALEEMMPLPTRVLIHDASRPFLSEDLLDRVKACLLDRSYGAWVPAIPVTETLKRVEDLQVVETIDCRHILQAQTPQVFEYAVIRGLAEKVRAVPELSFTDDVSLCEYYGIPVGVFDGDEKNIKLTFELEQEDLLAMFKEPRGKSPALQEVSRECLSKSPIA